MQTNFRLFLTKSSLQLVLSMMVTLLWLVLTTLICGGDGRDWALNLDDKLDFDNDDFAKKITFFILLKNKKVLV